MYGKMYNDKALEIYYIIGCDGILKEISVQKFIKYFYSWAKNDKKEIYFF